MNILFITPWYPCVEYPYGGIFIREYAKALQNQCEVTVLHCRVVDRKIHRKWSLNQINDINMSDGVPSYRVDLQHSKVPGVDFIGSLWSAYRAAVILSKTIGRPDVIHGHVYVTGLVSLLLGMRFKAPVVISEHFTAFARGLLSGCQIFKAKIAFRFADVVLPVSHALQTTLERHGIKAKFQIVPEVVNTGIFAYAPRKNSPNRALRLLTVTTLTAHKGLVPLFHALTMVQWEGQPWQLDVVGGGPEAMALHQCVRDLGLSANVHFCGKKLKSDVAQMMQEADLFVLPSLYETFSAATAEALASGLPAIVTRCGGPEEFVNEQSGRIVLPGDAKELAEAVEYMIRHLSEFDRKAIAREASQRFGSVGVANTLVALYGRLIIRGSASISSQTA